MIETVGVPAVKNDPFVAKLPMDINQQQSIQLRYKIDSESDIPQIKRVCGECVEVNYPVRCTDELSCRALIESQFAAYNAVADLDNTSVDQAINRLIPPCLTEEGLNLPDDPMVAARVQALMLKQIREFTSTSELIRYLQRNPSTAQLFGFDTGRGIPSESTFSNVRSEFTMERSSVQASIQRVQHTLFRNGVPPDFLANDFVSGQAIPQDSKLPGQLRYQGLINWTELLLRRLTDGISFNRAENSKYTSREIIAAVATMALHENFDKGYRLAQLSFQEDIITPTRLNQIVAKNIGHERFHQSKEAIEALGMELHESILQFAAEEVGFFSTPLDIAYDPTWVSLDEGVDPTNIDGAMGNITLEGDGGFCFATGVSFTPMARFSLGVQLVTDKSTLPDALRQMLLMMDKFADIGWVLADREFDNPETIEVMRLVAGDTWIIRLKKHNDLISDEEYRRLQNDGKAVVSFGGTDVNAFWKDISESKFNWVFDQSDNDFIVLSGMPLDETRITELSRKYSKRWSAETHIRELKHSFIPENQKMFALKHLFILNLSSIFYNIYKIINQSLSPRYGLPLRAKYYEVLAAIAASTFSPRSHPNPYKRDL